MTNPLVAADWSRFSTGDIPVSDDGLDRLRNDHGVGLIIPGAWHGSTGYNGVQISLERGRAKGFHTATYIALAPGEPGPYHVLQAYNLVGAQEWTHLSFAAIDIELPGVTAADVWAAMLDVHERGVHPVLYSRPGLVPQLLPLPPGVEIWSGNSDPWPTGRVVATQGAEIEIPTTPPFTVDISSFDADWFASLTDPAAGLAALKAAWMQDMADLTQNTSSLIGRPFDVTALALHSLYVSNRTEAWKKLLSGSSGGK